MDERYDVRVEEFGIGKVGSDNQRLVKVILEKCMEVFKSDLGTFRDFEAKLQIKEEVRPVFVMRVLLVLP